MSFLESLLRQSYEKIEDKKGNWCATPSTPKLRKVKGSTVKRGKPYDFLLGPVSSTEPVSDESESE